MTPSGRRGSRSARAGTSHRRSSRDRSHRWRGVRQPGVGNGLEAIRDDPGERWRREDAGGGGPEGRLGPPCRPHQRDHRQPSAEFAEAAGGGSLCDWRAEGDVLGHPLPHQDYHLPDSLPCPPEKTIISANLKTRLKWLDTVVQERPINWGHGICDAVIRKWVDAGLQPAVESPYANTAIG